MAKKTSKTELFGKHPLASSIEPVIREWSENGYPAVKGKQITHITRELFNYWFSDGIHEDECFFKCQQRAIESIIYCYEVLEIPSVSSLFETFSKELLEEKNLRHGIEDIKHPRYAVKMATGTGKTWFMNAIIIWQYFNRVKLDDERFVSHFALVAPGNIVYERLLDSFLGKVKNEKRQSRTIDINRKLFMPDDWRQDFHLSVFTKNDLQENVPYTDSPFILITNWHQLTDTSRKKGETLSEALGIDMISDSISLRVERFMDFLTYNNDLMIINDEAHHVHNATDSELKRWQESIEILRNRMEENDKHLFIQYDFTATPFTIKGNKKEFFSHVIYDYGLVEAMQDMLVKQIFIEKSSFLSGKIQQLPDNKKLMITAYKDDAKNVIELSEVQKHMIDVGIAKLDNLQKDFETLKINKKPVMFVMADNNEEADVITNYIKEKEDSNGIIFGDESLGEQVIAIHTKKKDTLSDDDYKKLKNTVFASDDASNPVRVIVSVMMLREGFDVKNVCVLVVLRRSDSDLLTEQVIGRGIRLMFPEPEYLQDKIENYTKLVDKENLINAYDLLFIVEHPKYNDIYDQLTKAGAQIASGSSIELSLDAKSVLIHVDEERVNKYDIGWPISLTHKTEEELDISQFDISKLPLSPQPFEDIHPSKILITDYHPTTQFRSEWELLDSNFTYGGFIRNTVRELIGSRKDSRVSLSRYAPEIAGVIDLYVSQHMFGRKIDFSNFENVEKLRNQQLVYYITNKLREAINTFLQSYKSYDVIEAEWIRLSEFKDLKIRMERAIETKKCLYPSLDFPYKGGLERKFTVDILENDPTVLSYVKLNQYVHKLSILYINSIGYLVPYYPDFLVKTEDIMYIIETKSAKDAINDIDVKRKAIAAEQRCRDISKIKTIPPIVQPREWQYILIPQNIMEEMEGSGFKSLIERCESNLAFLKMSQE